MSSQSTDFAVILAAGRGTRMKSTLAKVLHPMLGRPMVGHVVAAARSAGLSPVLVVNHQEEQVRAAFDGTDTAFARQVQTRGTGDAVASALSVLPDSGTVVVMAGDSPLIKGRDHPLAFGCSWRRGGDSVDRCSRGWCSLWPAGAHRRVPAMAHC
jgi:bifunctional N-acetylglucosamine-1-phosphate-uridyltransferase/glucosamine-1-phosphate-acetyltransferase GlmU-like protein